MGIIKEYIENVGGSFLNAQNCQDRATVTIQTIELDDETFDKAYIVITGIYDKTGEECHVRLGIQNINQIVKDLGEDETAWIGKKIEMVGTREYKGLGRTGLLWRGVSPSAPAPKQSSLEATISKILDQHHELSRNDIQTMMTDEIAKATGTLSEEAAAHLVAKSLKVK